MKKKNGLLQTFFYDFLKIQVTNWESRCRSPMSQFAIFFLDWRLKSASGDFVGA
jgi:hypothetical protein